MTRSETEAAIRVAEEEVARFAAQLEAAQQRLDELRQSTTTTTVAPGARVGSAWSAERKIELFRSDELDAVAEALGPRHGPMVIFAAATGLRPGEWIALEHRDIDRDARVAYVHRAFTNGRLKCTKTEASVRAVPLQSRALDALDLLPTDARTPLLFPSPSGGYLDLHNFRLRDWKPAQRRAGIDPVRRVYDLRHTFATLALRAGISTFDLSRYMGASLTMIDRHYGHLARDGREHAIRLLDAHAAEQQVATVDTRGRPVDTASINGGAIASGQIAE